jgi:hypothetical protein
MKRKHGLIGPLGDDIPSMFPIIAGIMIFIVSFIYISDQLAARNIYLELRKTTLQMSYIATEKGYMSNNEFDEKCDYQFKPFASKNSLSFAVILKKYCGTVKFTDQETLIIRKETVNGELIEDRLCTSDDAILLAQQTAPQGTPIDITNKNPIIMSYPIAVDCGNSLRGLGIISVAVWAPSRR